MSVERSSLLLGRLRRMLVQAAAEEHRLHQRAAEERRSERRWEQRATLAAERGLRELADRARSRATVHRKRGELLEARFEEQRHRVEQLRHLVRHPELAGTIEPRSGQKPLDLSEVEWRLAELDKEGCLAQDLSGLKKRRDIRRRKMEGIEHGAT